jgi:hypothetical protein
MNRMTLARTLGIVAVAVALATACTPSSGPPPLVAPPVTGTISRSGLGGSVSKMYYGCTTTGSAVWVSVSNPAPGATSFVGSVGVTKGYGPSGEVLGYWPPVGNDDPPPTFEGNLASVNPGDCFTIHVGIAEDVNGAIAYTFNW